VIRNDTVTVSINYEDCDTGTCLTEEVTEDIIFNIGKLSPGQYYLVISYNNTARLVDSFGVAGDDIDWGNDYKPLNIGNSWTYISDTVKEGGDTFFGFMTIKIVGDTIVTRVDNIDSGVPVPGKFYKVELIDSFIVVKRDTALVGTEYGYLFDDIYYSKAIHWITLENGRIQRDEEFGRHNYFDGQKIPTGRILVCTDTGGGYYCPGEESIFVSVVDNYDNDYGTYSDLVLLTNNMDSSIEYVAKNIGSVDFIDIIDYGRLQLYNKRIVSTRDGYKGEFELSGNVNSAKIIFFPNPFSRYVTIKSAVNAEFKIFDISGREITSLVSRHSSHVMWDGRDNHGRLVPNGNYILRTTTKDCIKNKMLTLIR
jgi:hypothetical protein